MTLIEEYQAWAVGTIVNPETFDIQYCTLGVVGEAGELAEQVKKMIRDDDGELTEERLKALLIELGDVLWYMTNLATLLGTSLYDIIAMNMVKLEDRHERGVVRGEGNSR